MRQVAGGLALLAEIGEEVVGGPLVEPGPALREAASRPEPAPTAATPYGDGQAAARVLDALAVPPA